MGRSALVVVAFAMVACKPPPPAEPAAPPPDPAAATAVVQLDQFRAQACACTEITCTLEVAGERATWLAAEHGKYTFTPEQRAAADTANRAFDACTQRRETDEDRAMRELAELSDRMCACTSKACADAVIEEMMTLGERYKDTKASDENMRRAETITERLTTCMSKAMQMTP